MGTNGAADVVIKVLRRCGGSSAAFSSRARLAIRLTYAFRPFDYLPTLPLPLPLHHPFGLNHSLSIAAR